MESASGSVGTRGRRATYSAQQFMVLTVAEGSMAAREPGRWAAVPWTPHVGSFTGGSRGQSGGGAVGDVDSLS